MKGCLLAIPAALSAFGLASATLAQTDKGFVYTFGAYTTVQPGGAKTYLTGINDSGVITGYAFSKYTGAYGFTESNGAFSTVDYPYSDQTFPQAISNNGIVTGTTEGYFPGQTTITEQSFLEKNGVYTLIQIGNFYSDTYAADVNNSGTVVGYYYIDSTLQYGAFVFSGGVTKKIGPIGALVSSAVGVNTAGEIAGSYETASGQRYGFVDNNGNYRAISYPDSTTTYLTGINDAGAVVGVFSNGANSYSFVESNGVYTEIKVPGSINTYASDINDKGAVTGYFYDYNGKYGFEEYGFEEYDGNYQIISVDGFPYTQGVSINDAGVVVGNTSAPAPEPAGWTLILAGLGCLGAAMRSRRQFRGRVYTI